MIAIFQDNRPSINLQTLLIRIGIGSIFFIWNVFKYVNYIQKSTYDNDLQTEAQNSLKSINMLDNIASYIWNNFFEMTLTTLPLIRGIVISPNVSFANWRISYEIRHFE